MPLAPPLLFVGSVTALPLLSIALCRWPVLEVLVLGVLPSIAVPFWAVASNVHFGWFYWAKLLSVLGGALLFLALRKLGGTGKVWSRSLVPAILGANILEAIVSQLQRGELLGAMAGVLVLLGMPGQSTVRTALDNARSLLYGSSWPWIAAYFFWNWEFADALAPERGQLSGFAANLAPVIVAAATTRERWLEARAVSLSLWMLLMFGFHGFFHQLAPWTTYRSAMCNTAVQVVSIGFGLAELVMCMVAKAKKQH